MNAQLIEKAKKIASKPAQTLWSIVKRKLSVNRMTAGQRGALHFILQDFDAAFGEAVEMHTEACGMRVGDDDTACTCWVRDHRKALGRLRELIGLLESKKSGRAR